MVFDQKIDFLKDKELRNKIITVFNKWNINLPLPCFLFNLQQAALKYEQQHGLLTGNKRTLKEKFPKTYIDLHKNKQKIQASFGIALGFIFLSFGLTFIFSTSLVASPIFIPIYLTIGTVTALTFGASLSLNKIFDLPLAPLVALKIFFNSIAKKIHSVFEKLFKQKDYEVLSIDKSEMIEVKIIKNSSLDNELLNNEKSTTLPTTNYFLKHNSNSKFEDQNFSLTSQNSPNLK